VPPAASRDVPRSAPAPSSDLATSRPRDLATSRPRDLATPSPTSIGAGGCARCTARAFAGDAPDRSEIESEIMNFQNVLIQQVRCACGATYSVQRAMGQPRSSWLRIT
jgi:hypothetical protein